MSAFGRRFYTCSRGESEGAVINRGFAAYFIF